MVAGSPNKTADGGCSDAGSAWLDPEAASMQPGSKQTNKQTYQEDEIL